MDISNQCASVGKDIREYRRRSIIRRLWESYALELITVLEMANKGKINQHVAQATIAELVPVMKQLRDGGELQKTLNRADLVILNKVFQQVSQNDEIDLNQVDLRDIQQ